MVGALVFGDLSTHRPDDAEVAECERAGGLVRPDGEIQASYAALVDAIGGPSHLEQMSDAQLEELAQGMERLCVDYRLVRGDVCRETLKRAVGELVEMRADPAPEEDGPRARSAKGKPRGSGGNRT